MSWNPAIEPRCPRAELDLVETLIIPRARDLGGFEVRRALPAPDRQMVGPFIFFDHVGPGEFGTGHGVDVRPHPHIGLGTVTYLFRGELLHRDSIGSSQMTGPGAVNWMVAGRGITHSERTPEPVRRGPHGVHGLQTWLALPDAHEDAEPFFEHHPQSVLPLVDDGGARVRLLLGHAFGERAPATMLSETFYADVELAAGSRMPLPNEHEERALYVIEGSVTIAGHAYDSSKMLVFRPGDAITVSAGERGARLVIFGGETFGTSRYLWWNFVASSRERIEEAKAQWRDTDRGRGRFALPTDDRHEHTPLPD